MILDTNALSTRSEGLTSAETYLRSADRLVIPSVVLGEYYFGIRQSHHRSRYEEWLRQYLPLTEITIVTSATARVRRNLPRIETAGQAYPDKWRLDLGTGPPALSSGVK